MPVPRSVLEAFFLLALLASCSAQGNWTTSNLVYSRYDLAGATDGLFVMFAGGGRYGFRPVDHVRLLVTLSPGLPFTSYVDQCDVGTNTCSSITSLTFGASNLAGVSGGLNSVVFAGGYCASCSRSPASHSLCARFLCRNASAAYQANVDLYTLGAKTSQGNRLSPVPPHVFRFLSASPHPPVLRVAASWAPLL
jgi:hypothetical protein